MLNPAPPTTEFFAPGMVITFAVLAIGGGVAMFFYQRDESPGRWRRQWPGRIMIPAVFIVFCAFVSFMALSFAETEKSDSRLMAQEIERVYGVEVSDSEARDLMDGKTIVVFEKVEQKDGKTVLSDGTAYRLEDDRLVEATAWEEADVPE